jgi:xanthine dehydrogenase YagR molybdenum-binding subunit
MSRVDGRAKVTGTAKYAAEYTAPGLAHGFVVSSAIAKGRIRRIHTADALAVDGVIDVFTHEHRPKLASSHEKYTDEVAPSGSPFRPLYDDKILFSGQPVAMVVAEEFEIARFAASLIRVEYERKPHVTDFEAQRKRGAVTKRDPSHSIARGNPAPAFEQAPVRIKAEYRMPVEHHNPMEPFAATAAWEGNGHITVFDKSRDPRTVATTLPACSGCRAIRCACCRPMSEADSEPDCARSMNYRSPCRRRAHSSARCG